MLASGTPLPHSLPNRMANIISIGEIIDRTWENYVKHFTPLMKISLWGMLIAVLVLIRIFILPEGDRYALGAILGGSASAFITIGFVIASIISLIAIPAITIWIYMNFVQASDLLIGGKALNMKTLNQDSKKKFWGYLWVVILRTLVTLAPLLAVAPGVILIIVNLLVGGGSLLGSLSLLLTFIGAIAALVLLIMVGVQLIFAGFEMLLAGKRGRKGLSGSRALVKGRFWPVLWRILIPKIVFGFGVLIAEIVVGMTIVLLSASLFNISEWVGIYGSVLLAVLVGTALRVLYAPIFVIADYLLYDSLRKNA